MKTFSHLAAALILSLIFGTPAVTHAQEGSEEAVADSFSETVSGLEHRTGFLDYYVDEGKGKIWLVVPADAWAEPLEMLYIEGLLSGLGSNPVGLDRGQLGDTRVVRLRPLGGKLLIEEVNLGFRALSDNALERLAVERSFATSVLWAGPITARDDGGAGLVDITSFLVRDAHGVAATLKRAQQGAFKLDSERSAVDTAAALAFPDNVEFEAVLTYSGSEPGPHVRSTAPTPEAITLIQHHSFVRLPDDGYTPRTFDPRAGSFAIGFADYATPLGDPLVKRWIVRHRLEKTNPGPGPSPVREPIVYYVDPGAPKAIQDALIDGALWWARAFEEAGFQDAYRVELLPADAHPLDVRYNVIQWVHRSTRGWSYGGGVTDPRTGEMIKGHVSLGSLRVRQDRLIFEGLAGADKTGSGAADDPVELALARIRQLSAHEVGHTLGITHNFAASTYGRASVMDYPAPLVTLRDDGSLDFSQAYETDIGSWDVLAIQMAHQEFGDEAANAAGREALMRQARSDGLIFISDRDARPAGAAHPFGHLWDNGSEPVAELRRLADLRAAALDRFGAHNLRRGAPMALLQETLAPVYFMHRFQILAAAKVVGGLDYRYAVNGEEGDPTILLDPAWQNEALDALLDLVEPAQLDLNDEVLTLLAPRPFGYGGNRELLASASSPAFDSMGAAATLSNMVISQLLQPERMARMVNHHRRDPSQPSLRGMLAEVNRRVFLEASMDDPRQAALARTVQQVALDRMFELSRSDRTARRVQTRLAEALVDLRDGIDSSDAQGRYLMERIDRFNARTEQTTDAGRGADDPPPGQPIGSDLGLADNEPGCAWGLDWAGHR